VFEIVPVRFEAFRDERPYPFPKKVVPQMLVPLMGPVTFRDE
jgi:hypothetical protein